jgi:hypothetical protein
MSKSTVIAIAAMAIFLAVHCVGALRDIRNLRP